MEWYGKELCPRDRFCIIACHVLWRELCYFGSLSQRTFQFMFLKQGLHCTPDLLRQELQAAVDVADPDNAALLLGYGLCSNGLVGIEARTKPLIVMRAHDCITFLLGSKERYREYFDSHPGTYWYTPGWIDTSTQPSQERYESVLQHYTETYGEENAKYLMEASENWMVTYNKATYVDLGFGDTEKYKEYTRTCAEWLKWETEFLQGDPTLVKQFLDGPWDNERFLVVQPGEKIVASHDEYVIAAAPIDAAP